MKFKQIIFFILCVIQSTHALAKAPSPILVTPNTGLVLVHGTQDHRNDALGHYWKTKHIDNLSKPLFSKEKLLVVHCNFNKYMWDSEAGGCVAKQVSQFIDAQAINQLIIITHSNGGNVIRWILSHPTLSQDNLKLVKTTQYVIAIAPSSNGTRLAELASDGTAFEQSLGWLLGYTSDAVKQQRSYDMAIYNQFHLYGTKEQINTPVPFYNIVGTNVAASPFNADNYCNGYHLNLGLKTTRIFLDDCSDGFLNCHSQNSAGQLWFYDVEKTIGHKILNHNQSRHDCFGLAGLLNNLFKH
jgi:hypothetical protein